MPPIQPAGDMPLVTILVPMYNEERYIAGCLDSILNQTFDMSRAEVLIIDGRSTDRSPAIAAEYAARHPIIRVIENALRILPAGLNLGIRQARGRYVLQMDSHCEYSSTYVAQIVATFEETGAHNICNFFEARPGADTAAARAVWLMHVSRFGAGASYGRQPGPPKMIGPNEHVTSGWSFRKAAFDQAGVFDLRLARNSDLDMSRRVHAAGLGVFYDTRIKATYLSRATIGAYVRTMFRNGMYLPLLWRLHPTTWSIMHSVPACFVLALLVGGVASAFWRPAQWAILAVGGAYALIALIESARLAWRHGLGLMLVLPWLFFLTHVAYGLGTLVGLAKFMLPRSLPMADHG